MPRSKKNKALSGQAKMARAIVKATRAATKASRRNPVRNPISGIPVVAESRQVRSRLELSHSGAITKVRLCDQIVPFAGSTRADIALTATLPFSLKGSTSTTDAFAQILPKLQGFASVHQRYRVTRAQLMYQPLCNSLTTGNLGMVIQDGFVGGTRTIAEMASYQQSVVGPLYVDKRTSEWRNLEQRWFYTNDAFSAQIVPFTMNFIMLGGATPATQLTGLFWLDLTIEFIDLRPVPSTRLLLTAGDKADQPQPCTQGAAPESRTVKWNRAPGMSGLWGWATGQERTIVKNDNSGTYTLGSKQAWDMDSGRYVGCGRLSVLAEGSMEVKAGDPNDDSYVRLLSPPAVKRYSARDIDGFNSVFTHAGPPRKGYTKVLCSFPTLAEARAARLAGFDPHAGLPDVAGDFSVALYCQDEDGPSEVVYSKLFSLGTAATVAEFIFNWFEDNPCTLSLIVTPSTAGATRIIEPLKSILSIQEVDESVPALD